MRDCPVKELVHDGTLPLPTQAIVLAPEDRIFDETVSDFIGALGAYQFLAHPPDPAIGSPSEAEARALLTPRYSATLTTLEDARTPMTLDRNSPEVTFDHLETTIWGRRATQNVVYCLHQGGNWTQVFHLEHVGVEWRIDVIEPAKPLAGSSVSGTETRRTGDKAPTGESGR